MKLTLIAYWLVVSLHTLTSVLGGINKLGFDSTHIKDILKRWVWVKIFWPGSARVNICWLGLVGLGQPSMVWVWKFSTKNVKKFNFFPSNKKKSLLVGSKITQVKDGSSSYLLRVKSMLGPGRVRVLSLL